MDDMRAGRAEFVTSEVTGDEVGGWRVITAANFGRLIPKNDDGTDGEGYQLVVEFDTTDVDGRNPATVRFGVLNVDVLGNMVGSAGMTILDDEQKSRDLFNVWAKLLTFLDTSDGEHDPNCPHHH